MNSLSLHRYSKALYTGKFVILLIGIIAGASAWIVGAAGSELFQSSATIELSQTAKAMFSGSQNKNPLMIRSQDINPALGQRGRIEIVFHQASDVPARLEINALASSPDTARLLSSEATKIFFRRAAQYESGSAKLVRSRQALVETKKRVRGQLKSITQQLKKKNGASSTSRNEAKLIKAEMKLVTEAIATIDLVNETTLIKNGPTKIKVADKVKKVSKPIVLKTVLAGLVGLLVGIGLIGTMEYFRQNQANSTLPSKYKSSSAP